MHKMSYGSFLLLCFSYLLCCCLNPFFFVSSDREFIYKSRYTNQEYQIPPKVNHSFSHFEEMVAPQRNFILKNQHISDFISNPSMTRHPRNENQIIFVTRIWTRTRERVDIGVMDTSFRTIVPRSRLQILVPEDWQHDLFAEDVRIFAHNYELYLYYMFKLHKGCVFLAKLLYNSTSEQYYVYKQYQQLHLESEHQTRHEKNWIGFEFCPNCEFENGILSVRRYREYIRHHPELRISDEPDCEEYGVETSRFQVIQHGVLYFVYSIQPHIIVKLYPHSRAELIFATEIQNFSWVWGELRGGSPALPINNDSYLAFTHSSGPFNQKGILTYLTSAYLFSRHPPFAITHMTPEPIIHQDFIDPQQRWSWFYADFITFPVGFTMDNETFYVSYGRNDREGYILHLHREKFLQFLVPVETRVLGHSEMYPNQSDVVRGTFRYLQPSQENGRLPFYEKYGPK